MKDEYRGRISAEPPESPRLVIKTNLDALSPAEENPYYEKSDKEKADAYFKEQ